MSHPIDNYINYKNENVAIYTKKEFENQNIYEHMVGKVSWMHIELEDFGVNIIEFIDSHEEGSYKEINRLINLRNLRQQKQDLYLFRDNRLLVKKEDFHLLRKQKEIQFLYILIQELGNMALYQWANNRAVQ